jgi:hypothetical protein
MLQKPTDKLMSIQRKCLWGGVIFIILVPKTNLSIFMSDQSMVTDGDPLGIIAQISDQILRIGERFFTIHHPLGSLDKLAFGTMSVAA